MDAVIINRLFAVTEALAQAAAEMQQLILDLHKKPTGGAPPVDPWRSPDLPEGYDTIVGYMAKRYPWSLDLLADPRKTAEDGRKLARYCKVRGLPVIKVAAPPAFKEAGIEVINAYPEAALNAVLGA